MRPCDYTRLARHQTVIQWDALQIMLLKNKRIFIVEDNTGNLAIASIYLENQGAKIKFERRGLRTTEAIIQQMPIDLILTDLMLPTDIITSDIYNQIRQ